jgi:hypothetical protein
MTGDIIDFPDFAAAARALGLAPWQERALAALAESEDGPRPISKWCSLLNTTVREDTERAVQEIRDISEVVQREREDKAAEDRRRPIDVYEDALRRNVAALRVPAEYLKDRR